MENEILGSDFKTRVTDKPVLVVGGTGFLGGHIIQQLLQRGYRVRSTVRDLRKPETFAYLSRLPNAAENLELVEVVLTNPSTHESWEAAFDHVEYVIHTACPTNLTSSDPKNELIDPTLLGCRAVLECCHRSPNVKKLVLTSCMTAITDIYEPDRKYSEDDWNETATPNNNPLSYCKTYSESEAYSMVNHASCAFKLVTVLPGTMLGPHLGNKVNFSHRFLLAFMQEGAVPVCPNLSYAIVDVRDAAKFHIACMENAELEGRFICANLAISLQKILQIVHENFSDLKIPARKVADVTVRLFGARKMHPSVRQWVLERLSKPPLFSRKKSQKVGVPLRNPAETVVDTCRFFMDAHLVAFSGGGDTFCTVM